MTILRDAALRYADDGWAVFPLYGIVDGRCECGTDCGSPGKHPRISGGVLSASSDSEKVEAWWKRWPNANIGVATGATSGIYVLDIDNKRSVDLGNGILVSEGENSIRVKELEIGKLPETRTSQTGSGGLHLIYSYPGTTGQTPENGSTASFGNRAGILSSVDTRGDGGYIVAPPSLHQSGNRYRWTDQDQPITNLPGRWVSLISSSAPGSKALDLDIPEGFTIREGEGRHDWLFRMGSKLRGQHGLGQMALFGALSAYNRAVLQPPLSVSEVEHIVGSCLKYDPEIKIDRLAPDAGPPEIPEAGDLATSLAELLDEDIPPPEPLIDKIINRGDGVIIGGPPNVGKSWLVMDMMLSVASGTPFIRHFDTSKAGVLFVDEEGSRRGDKRRFEMLVAGRDASASDFPLHVKIGADIRLDEERGFTALARMMERYRPGVVVLDSLVRVHGGEESSSRAMADFFRRVKKMAGVYDSSFVFTHHIRKPGADNKNEDPLYMLRGSGDIQGWPDSILICLPTDDPTEMKVVHTKMREGPKHEIFLVGLKIVERDGYAQLAFRPYDQHGKESAARSMIRTILASGRMMTLEEIAGAVGMTPSTVKDHLKVMEAINHVSERREGTKTYYQKSFRVDG